MKLQSLSLEPARSRSLRLERPALLESLKTWTLPALAVVVPLACSAGLRDGFELPKLFVLKLGLVLVLLALVAEASIDISVLRTAAALAVLVFLGLNVVATMFSVEPRTALLGAYLHDQGLLTLAVHVTYFYLAATWIRSETTLARLAAAFALAASGVSLYAVAQYFGLDPLGWRPQIEDGRRTYGTIGHPNSLGEYLALTIPFTAWLAWRQRGLQRDLSLWGLAVQLLALALTQARAAWVAVLTQALIAGPLVLCLRGARGRRLGPLLALAPLVAAFAVFVALLVQPATARRVEATVATVVERGEPLRTRQYLWHSALAMVADRPLLGWGPDTFQLAYPAYRSTELDAHYGLVGRDDAVHNILLGVAVNAGLLGAAAYLVVQATILKPILAGVFGTREDTPFSRRTAGLVLLFVWISYVMVYTVGEHRVTTDWLTWVAAGSAIGLFAARLRSPRPIRAIPRLAAAILAVGLITEASSGLAADAAYVEAIARGEGGSLRDEVVWLERAASLRPFEPFYQQQLGLSMADLGREMNDTGLFVTAVDRLTSASALWGQREPYVLTQLARITLDREAVTGQSTEAPFQYAQRAIELDPQNPLLHAEAAALAARRDRVHAEHEYWEAAMARSVSPDALERLGEVALRRGDSLAARTAFREAAQREWRRPLQARLYRSWGEAALSSGFTEEAALAFGQTLEREPGDLATRLKRAEVLAASGQPEEALAEARRALDHAPTDQRAISLVDQLGGR